MDRLALQNLLSFIREDNEVIIISLECLGIKNSNIYISEQKRQTLLERYKEDILLAKEIENIKVGQFNIQKIVKIHNVD